MSTTIFPPSSATSANALSVAVPPFVVWISNCTANADPTQDPSYGNWAAQPSLEVLGIFKGSSAIGQSHAKLRVATGAPLTADDANIESSILLNQGDRVLIGLDEGGDTPRWLFGGYMVQAKIEIHGAAESEEFKIVGPEWIWGVGPVATGSINPVCGQIRRQAIADDAFAVGTVTTAFSNLAQLSDMPAVFNPLGRKNMSVYNATFSTNTGAVTSGDVLARPWETEDRKLAGAEIAAAWTKDQAIRSLYLWYNNPSKTGITLDDSTMPTGLPMRHVSVEGMGIWEAMRLVCGQEWAFCVDPTPDTSATTGNNNFKGFTLYFFDRSDGATANLVLNPLGTAGTSASFSVSRLQAAKDASKVCNKVMVLAKHLRHVKLQYFGSHTTSAGTNEKKLSLQHGWTQGDGDLKDYAAKDSSGNWNVDAHTIDSKGTSFRDDWTNKFTKNGASFATHSSVFRMFTWNEAGELANGTSDPASNKASYGPPSGSGGAGVSLAYYAPDLANIADATNHAGIYCRRRRKLLDTGYFDNTIDSRQRLRPTLYLRAATMASDTVYGNWYQVPTSHYRLDEQRGAIWITHEDISQWHPLREADADDTEGDAELQDDRTFATLLFTGKLRMLLECSVETDWLKEYVSDVTASAGIPLVRLAYIRADRDYYFTEDFADGVTSPSSATITPRDDSTLAQAYADNAKLRGQDQITHASILVEADWPEQPIGMMVQSTTGRVVNLAVNGTGKGVQICGLNLLVSEMKWELVLESSALRYRTIDHGEVNKYKTRRKQKFGQADDVMPLYVPDMPEDGSD